MKIKFGFTLAEVLITLGVIGVVAAITMPTLIKNYQQQQMLNQLKRVYSNLGQVIARSEADNGFIGEWDFDIDTNEFVKRYLIPYINVVYDCDNATDECPADFTYKFMNGNDGYARGSSWYRLSTADGVKYRIGISASNPPYPAKLSFVIDINGNKGPQVSGKDIFNITFWANARKLSFEGSDYNGTTKVNVNSIMQNQTNGCNKTATKAGHMCGWAIFANGWKIPDNYPW